MFTQCPECETTFRLSAADLRRAEGKVRCGECNSVFNALESLAEETESESAGGGGGEPWLTDSGRNPPGELDPDLDTYERYVRTHEDFEPQTGDDAAQADTLESAEADELIDTTDGDDEDDDTGAILYIGDDEADAAELDAAGLDAEDLEAGAEPDDADNETAGDAEPSPDDDLADEFDDSVWDSIPGVGATADAQEAEALDEAADAEDADEADEAGEGDEDSGPEESLDDTDDSDSDEAEDNDDEDVDEDEAEPAEDTDTADEDDDDMEFNVPADKWSNFFGPLEQGEDASVWQPPALDDDEATEDGDDDDDEDDDALTADADEDDDAPLWRGELGTAPNEAAPSSRGPLWLVGFFVLGGLLVSQLVHYNRDALAASKAYGNTVRSIYENLNSDLYPEWPIDGYDIRGSEAVVGESGSDVLDIRAQIAVTHSLPVGLPRLRVVLRDRWSNPVAARDFGPDEYADAGEIPADGMLAPGSVLNTHVSIVDPGSGAQGFELELCLPRRHTGLECTGQPFK